MSSIVINPGPISSFNSLNYYMAPKLKQIREMYSYGQTPKISLDLSKVEFERMSIPALVAFLSLAKRLRDFVGAPIPVILKWDPVLQGAWSDINFFEIAERFDLFEFPKDAIGGFLRGRVNHNTKLLFFADVQPQGKNASADDIVRAKMQLKQKIAPNYFLRISELFRYTHTSSKLENLVANTTIELIVNSLIHGEDIAFVGLKKSKSKISVTVCDTGIGFPSSLKRSYAERYGKRNIAHVEALLIGSLIQKNEHGLRLAINDVLNYSDYFDITDPLKNQGTVIISSYDAEIRWQKKNWAVAKHLFEQVDPFNDEIPIEEFLGTPVNQYLSTTKLWSGYWKKYDNRLVGTRITFEIILDK